MLLSDIDAINSPKDCDFLALDESGLLFEKEHAYADTFRHPATGVEFTLTEAAIDHFAKETNRYIENGNKSDLPVEHTTDPERNRGQNIQWYTKKDSKGRHGLFSKTKFRDAEAAKLAETAQTSIYCPGKTEDGKKNQYVRAIKHVALTDNPVIPGLDGFTPIAASLVVPTPRKEKAMSVFKGLADTIGLQLSEDVDDEKATTALVEYFKKNGSSKEAFDALQLSFNEYKTANPPQADPVRVSKAQVAMLRENRELKLSNLVDQGKILPCVSKELQEVFCGEATLTLALSEDAEDNFDAVISALKDNDPIKLSEVTGPQAQTTATLLDEKTNPLMAAAVKRAGN